MERPRGYKIASDKQFHDWPATTAAVPGDLIQRFRLRSGEGGDDIVEDDVILLWNHRPRVVTGPDILGRLLRGIAIRATDAGEE